MTTLSVPSLLIVSEGDADWHVWMSLEDHDPLDDAFGFIIGSGETRDAAVADAVASLEAATARLQSPPGVVPERAS